MDIRNYCLLTDPSGLGVEFDLNYEPLGFSFIENANRISQGKITGIANFMHYDNYKELIDFIAFSKELKILYKVPYRRGDKTYYRDVKFKSITKSELDKDGVLKETIVFDLLSLWYEENQTTYVMEPAEDSLIWDFKWDSIFIEFSNRSINFVNNGHIEASIDLVIDGEIENPKIELYVDNKIIQQVEVNTRIEDGEKFHYSSREGKFEIAKVTDSEIVNLYDLDNINFANDNVIRIPINKSCSIKIEADTDIESAILKIYTYYYAI
ncbi:MAG: phage baseplate protein [Clostridia bacterium]|nr:phage baseplate protein [Clostridia bacterium]